MKGGIGSPLFISLRCGDIMRTYNDKEHETFLAVTACISILPVSCLRHPLATCSDSDGRKAEAKTELSLQAASKRPLSAEDIERAVGQLGDNLLGIGSLDLSGLDLAAGDSACSVHSRPMRVFRRSAKCLSRGNRS